MFIKKLKLYFLIIIVSGTIFLGYSFYKNYQFKMNQLSPTILKEIDDKQQILRSLAFYKYRIKDKIPIIISDKLPSKLFGLTTLDEKQNIKIYLNKKRFKESSKYMI